jgi:hypothetical protein
MSRPSLARPPAPRPPHLPPPVAHHEEHQVGLAGVKATRAHVLGHLRPPTHTCLPLRPARPTRLARRRLRATLAHAPPARTHAPPPSAPPHAHGLAEAPPRPLAPSAALPSRRTFLRPSPYPSPRMSATSAAEPSPMATPTSTRLRRTAASSECRERPAFSALAEGVGRGVGRA